MSTIQRTVAVSLTALAVLAVTAVARQRPTFAQSHLAAHIVLHDYAYLVDGLLVVGPCRRVGAWTTVCRARLTGPSACRYRVLVTGTVSRNFFVTVRAR